MQQPSESTVLPSQRESRTKSLVQPLQRVGLTLLAVVCSALVQYIGWTALFWIETRNSPPAAPGLGPDPAGWGLLVALILTAFVIIPIWLFYLLPTSIFVPASSRFWSIWPQLPIGLLAGLIAWAIARRDLREMTIYAIAGALVCVVSAFLMKILRRPGAL
jgi:hypothetical protein